MLPEQNVHVRRRTEVLQVDPADPDPASIDRAARIIRSGGLVAFPTETVYGLGVDAMDAAAVRTVFEAKGRPATDPLIVHVLSAAGSGPSAQDVTSRLPTTAQDLADRFWPGPLTLVLPRAAGVPTEVSAGLDSVAVRAPAHPVARALIAAARRPIAAPSANRFGRVSPTTAAHVLEELDGRFDLVLDGGPTPLGVESSVLDLGVEPPVLLRPGGVSLEALREVLGQVDHEPRRIVADDAASSAPGQLLGHYAPTTPVYLLEGSAAEVGRLVDRLDELGIAARPIELAADADEAARELYSTLRELDGLGADVLLVRAVSTEGIGRAVNDRLFRAAHGRVLPSDRDDAVAVLRRDLGR